MAVPQVNQGILLTACRMRGQAYSGLGGRALSLSQAGLLEAGAFLFFLIFHTFSLGSFILGMMNVKVEKPFPLATTNLMPLRS